MPIHEILKEKKLKLLAFAGVTTEVCVQTTMREANDRDISAFSSKKRRGAISPNSRRPPST